MKETDWQPMETAPKNEYGTFFGPVILIWCIGDGRPWPACWRSGGPDNAGCWGIVDDFSPPEQNEIFPDDAAAWMPIVAPLTK